MQIFIHFVGRSQTILNVEPSTIIKELEEMLIERFNLEIPIQHYDLRYLGKPLNYDYKTIADYNIFKESTIDIFVKNPINLKSIINIKFNNDIIIMDFPCFCCYSILDYKKEIYKKRGYPIECQSLYSDENGNIPLEDNDHDSLPVLLIIDEKDLLTKGYRVKYFDGVNTYDIISGNDLENIKDIKEEIQNKKKIPKGSFELIYDNRALSDGKKLSDYYIYYQSIINLVVEKKYEKLLFDYGHFYVKYQGKSYTAGIQDLTILGIKKYFVDAIFKNKIEINKIKIIFRGIILEDNLNLENEGLCGRKLDLIVFD